LIFKFLIEILGCDVNVQDDNKNTPLHDALRYFDPNEGGDITVLMYLLNQKGVNGNITGESGCTLLHYACKHINKLPVDVFKLLIESHGCNVNVRDNDKDTPIHCAFPRFDPNNDNNIAVLAYLISQNNFNVNIKDQDDRTFLHLACICEIGEDGDDYMDSEDEFSDSEDDGNDLKAKSDAGLSQIVEIIAKRCVQEIVDDSSS
jgi:ankyrin repeat protein